jgi:predicted amino acid dehydrogenase
MDGSGGAMAFKGKTVVIVGASGVVGSGIARGTQKGQLICLGGWPTRTGSASKRRTGGCG